jgi:sigma-E factor negative regulatory protein RseA
MKARISAMVDGELDERSWGEAYDQLGRDGEAIEAWRTYHLISDAMRGSRVLSGSFTERVASELAREPTVIAPGRLPAPERRRWVALSAAASLAAISLVGWVAFAPQESASPFPAIQAQSPQPTVIAQPAAMPQPASSKPMRVPPPVAANDYLLAHQAFSPRISLQGMAPYARTVSEPASRASR